METVECHCVEAFDCPTLITNNSPCPLTVYIIRYIYNEKTQAFIVCYPRVESVEVSTQDNTAKCFLNKTQSLLKRNCGAKIGKINDEQ
ncbi:hypothetical protein [Bacteroides sp.]